MPSRSPLLVLVCALLAGAVGARCEIYVASTSHPPRSHWQPEGERLASAEELANPVIPLGDRFHAFHGGLRSADEVGVAYAPVFEATFTVEDRAFVPEGPTFDSHGNLYFTPLIPSAGTDLDRVLIALDGETGERLFDVAPGQLGQGGAPLILRDPDGGNEVIYTGGYFSVYAVDRQGQVLWNTGTGLPLTGLSGLHLYGIQYHPATDTVMAEYGSGDIVAFDRSTGARLGHFESPGAPAKSVDALGLSEPLSEAFLEAFREGFELPNLPIDIGPLILNALLGGGNVIANYFGVDPDSARIWVASTLEDAADGTVDGEAEIGALYGIDVTRSAGPGGDVVEFTIQCAAPFPGGSAATPAIRPGGDRIYTADNLNRVLAFDRDCNEIWGVDVGEQVVASIAVSSVSGELFAPTSSAIVKIEDLGESGALRWEADIAGAYRGLALRAATQRIFEALHARLEELAGREVPARLGFGNLDLAGIGENGIMIQTGFGIEAELTPGNATLLPLLVTMNLIDRETGRPINSTRAVEETVSSIGTGPNGTTAIGNSPVRRTIVRGLALDLLEEPAPPPELVRQIERWAPPLTGGVTRYAVVERFDLLARDSTCGASRRLANTAEYAGSQGSETGVAADARDVLRLVAQAGDAVERAREVGELASWQARGVERTLGGASLAIAQGRLSRAVSKLGWGCLLLNF